VTTCTLPFSTPGLCHPLRRVLGTTQHPPPPPTHTNSAPRSAPHQEVGRQRVCGGPQPPPQLLQGQARRQGGGGAGDAPVQGVQQQARHAHQVRTLQGGGGGRGRGTSETTEVRPMGTRREYWGWQLAGWLLSGVDCRGRQRCCSGARCPPGTHSLLHACWPHGHHLGHMLALPRPPPLLLCSINPAAATPCCPCACPTRCCQEGRAGPCCSWAAA
jgi:hypothetical protein